MRKKLFFRYFAVCAVIIVTSFVFLCGIFGFLMTKYIKDERQTMLSENVSKAVDFTKYNYEMSGGRYIEKRSTRQFYEIVSDASNGVVFFVDVDGYTQICTEDGACVHELSQISQKTLEKVRLSNEYMEFGKLDGVYKIKHYTVGKAVTALPSGEVIGYVFASASARATTGVVSAVFRLFLMSIIFTILLSSIVIYFLTQMLSRPLRQMSVAAKSFGHGDFSARISYSKPDEIGELAKSFNQMADSLSELESARKNFVSNVSHELKTPMTTIGGFIDGILDGTIPKEQEEYYLRLVSEEVKRLTRLVKSMLNVANIEAGKTTINAKDVNINEIIIKTLFNFEKRINQKNIDIIGLDELDRCIIIADEDLIHQVIYNLIDNAVKFCNDNGIIEFSTKKADNKAHICIKNSGEGISKEEIAHIFDRFYKTDKSRGIDKNGVGLGLHIVKNIINMHGGEIVVGSVEGEYTEFVVTLPLSENDFSK